MDSISRCIDDFLIHPTTPLLDKQTGVSPTHIEVASKANVTHESIGQEKWKSVDFATNMLHDLAERPLTLHEYHSDEELASPMDGNDEDEDSDDQDSFEDSVSTFSDSASLSESLSEEWDESDDDDYINAETVTILTVGKPKVVSLPASPTTLGYFDVPVPSLTSAPLDGWRDEKFFAERLTNVHDHQDVAPERAMQQRLDAPFSPDLDDYLEQPIDYHHQHAISNIRHRSPSLPLNLAHPQQLPLSSVPMRKQSLMASTRTTIKDDADVASHAPYPSRAFHSLRGSSLRPALSLRKLSPSIFARFGKTTESPSRTSDKDSPVVDAASLTPVAPSRPKMVARSANERAKPITLPPCPAGYEPVVDSIDVWELARQSSMSSRKIHHGHLRHGL